MRTINVAAFKAGWRKACAKWEIDPASGPNTFQMLGYKAKVEEDKKRAAAEERRWATAEGLARLKNWGFDPTKKVDEETAEFLTSWGAYRSSTEKEALAHVRAEAKAAHEPMPTSSLPVESWVRLTLEETVQALKEDDAFENSIPLREIHARKQVELKWIDLYDGRPLAISVLVPAK